jgi:hypothetical protein
MAGCGRFRAVRTIVALAAAALGVSASGAAAEAATNPLQITVQVGYHSSFKLGEWMPVAVDLTNQGSQIDGTLEIDGSNSLSGKGGPPVGSAVYQTPLSLASGATKHFRTYVSQDFPGTVNVRVVQGGHVVASQAASVSNTVSGLLVGILSDDPSALDGIAAIHPAGNTPTVVHIGVADLPDSALVLRAFDLIAVDNFSTDTLTAGQKNALVDYVMQGGSLLVGTGGSWHKTLAGLPDAIVPMQVTGSTVLASSRGLGGLTGIEIATGSLRPGTNAWLAEGSRPLIIEAQVGSGLVGMSTFDWAQGSVVASADANTLLRQVVIRSTLGSINTSGASSIAVAKGGGVNTSVAARGGSLSSALANVPALDLPAWWLIGVLVLLYILVVGPVNYFVLRAAGRRALAWITVPAIAVVASGGAYGASIVTKGTAVVANEISIIHVQPGWDRAYNEDYTGIVAPTRGDYEVSLGSRQTMISPIYYYSNSSDPSLGLMRVNTATGGITLPGMTAFTLRGFASETITSAPSVTGTAHIVGGNLVGTIKNVSSVTFSDGVVFSGSAYQMLNRLGPGGSEAFSLAPSMNNFNGPPVFMQIYPNALCCMGGPPNSNSRVERRNETRTAILSTLSVNNYAGLPTSATPLVVLWTDQPFQQVSVNGGHPRTYMNSAVVLTLPVGQVGSGALPAGVIGGRLIDIDATLNQGGPPGLLIAESGSLTYSFLPSLAPGTHLTKVSITSNNIYGPKFANGTGGPVTVKGYVWDWTNQAWVSISYADNALTQVPDSAVNPTTGEVRFKESADGQFTAGQLTIQGTVK